ncbi:MAG TPA: hypothetical protein PK861_00390 [Thermomonas sp.]|nr:hypothetical protein [Thermomonas sp.]
MKRSGFQSKLPPRREATQSTYTARPRAAAVAVHDGKARMVVPVPKREYVRDERLRDMCRAMACQHCYGATCGNVGVTWAHSNQGRHGKGKNIKASDQFVAAMGTACHAELDQGKTHTQAQKVAIWERAHARTVALALQLGTWPAGVPVPGTATESAT